MSIALRLSIIAFAGFSLTGCIVQSEQSKQQEAVEYQMQQHDAAKCADAGLLPGSDAFKACMNRLEGVPAPAIPATR